MRRLVGLLVLVALFVAVRFWLGKSGRDSDQETPVAASDDAATVESPSEVLTLLEGVWTGKVEEEDRVYDATLSFAKTGRTLSGKSDYPSFPCAGDLRFRGEAGGGVQFAETITTGRSLCGDGLIEVHLEGENRAVWKWIDQIDRGHRAIGTFSRHVPD